MFGLGSFSRGPISSLAGAILQVAHGQGAANLTGTTSSASSFWTLGISRSLAGRGHDLDGVGPDLRVGVRETVGDDLLGPGPAGRRRPAPAARRGRGWSRGPSGTGPSARIRRSGAWPD